MDIFDRIIAATSMNEEQRKLKAIPLLQELVTLTTGEACFLKLNEKKRATYNPVWPGIQADLCKRG